MAGGDIALYDNYEQQAEYSATALNQPAVNLAGNSGEAGNTSLYRFIPASGNSIIDGRLSGVAWKFNNFSVAYPSASSAYGSNYGSGEQGSFSPFNQAQTLVSNFAISYLGDITQMTFVNGNQCQNVHGNKIRTTLGRLTARNALFGPPPDHPMHPACSYRHCVYIALI